MTDGELTVAILREIRDEIRSTNRRLDVTNDRLDRVVHEQIRHATAIVELEAGQRKLVDAVGTLEVGQRKIVDAVVALDAGQQRIVAAIETLSGSVQGLNARLDNVLIGPMGQQVRDHEKRLERVESHLGLSEE